MKDIDKKEKIKSNQLINEYHNTINSNFKKNPNFKYKLDLIKFDDLPYNIKKTFDIFTSHYDNKVYMAYSDDYKITIFDLLERKKIRELNIKCNTYIKYFINQNNFKEYLLLGYRTELLDINNNYNIIYQNNEDTSYNDEEYTMFFPENTNNEYIIKSDYRGYGGETSSSSTVRTHLYSLNEKKVKQIFYNYYQDHDDYGKSGEDIGSIGHLLVWHNEKIIIIIFYNLQK